MASIIPNMPLIERDSRSRKNAKMVTQIGPVETRTTEADTLVYSSEVIQVEKWMDKNNPERIINTTSFFEREYISDLCFIKAIGAINTVDMINLKAAITIDGASSWANLMKIEAVDTENNPNTMRKGNDLGFSILSIYNSNNSDN